MKMKPKTQPFQRLLSLFLILSILLAPVTASADTYGAKSTGIQYQISAAGEYANWDGVSNVSQFSDASGNYCFAYDGSKSVVVVKTKNGKPLTKTVKLQKKYPLFGGVTCDSEGNYYLASGRVNNTDDTSKSTVFVSKYDKNGKLLKTVGDNGSSSLGYWYSSEFYTKIPFEAGNCTLAVNGDYLIVHYAREMYSGHQSNSVLAINMRTMKKVNVGNIYSSHSFAQRVVPYRDGFVLASEGDCYSRAFTVTAVTDMTSSTNTTGDCFHFWVRKNALADWDMYAVNNNFAHMGGIVAVGDDKAALIGTSVKSLSSKATSESEQLFIQIFDPTQSLDKKSAYVTSGTRSGYSGGNGDEAVTDYGVKWLTSYSSQYRIAHPQAVTDGSGNIVVLYELYKSGSYKGVYYMVVGPDGKILTKKTKYSSTAYLNPYEMPVCSGGTIYWTGNKYKNTKNTMYVYSLKTV